LVGFLVSWWTAFIQELSEDLPSSMSLSLAYIPSVLLALCQELDQNSNIYLFDGIWV
jgi:hypothetical protein